MLSFVAQKLVMFDYITKGEDSHCFGVNYYTLTHTHTHTHTPTHPHTPTHTNTHTCEKFLGVIVCARIHTREREV
jgi:hypothetical protein